MPIPTPILDDRSYQQLRDELVRRIRIYTPEWTDHNPSDPGITLIELFAFLGENLLFRFNQIPESTHLAFLRLLQIPMRPAGAARALLEMTTKIPEGVLVSPGAEAKAGGVSFEVETEVRVWPLSLQAVSREKSRPPETPEEVEFAGRAMNTVEPGVEPIWYRTQLLPTDPTDPDVPLDFSKAVDGILWIAVVRTKETRPELLGEAIVSVGIHIDESVTGMADVEACPGDGVKAASHAVVWQVSTGKLDKTTGAPIYETLTVISDTTRGLAQNGVIQIRLPRRTTDFGLFPLGDPDQAGTGDLPPEIEDEQISKGLLFWLRAFRRDKGARPLERVLWLGANAAEVIQTRKAHVEYLGTGTGQPNQRFPLVHKPIVEGSVRLQVEDEDGWRDWQNVESLHASTQDDRHYIVDHEAGEVRFGDVIRGFVPQLGQRIRVTEYRWGGGPDGNVGARAINKLPSVSDVKAAGNPLPARGGAAAETVANALNRIPGELRRRDRAVTVTDFQELALATPGAEVGRAECLPLFHPPTKNPKAAGVVSVIVWPTVDRKNPNAPMPDRTLISAVCQWLDARRLVTTELHVIPPTYRKVAVAVGVKVKPGYPTEGVLGWVKLVIRQYLAPLPPFGPEGRGWPLGRRVHGPELMAAALQVEGVEYLEGDGLKVAGAGAGGAWVPGTVDLQPYEVPELVEITVVAGVPMEPGIAPSPPGTDEGEPGGGDPDAKPKVPVPIPTVKVEC